MAKGDSAVALTLSRNDNVVHEDAPRPFLTLLKSVDDVVVPPTFQVDVGGQPGNVGGEPAIGSEGWAKVVREVLDVHRVGSMQPRRFLIGVELDWHIDLVDGREVMRLGAANFTSVEPLFPPKLAVVEGSEEKGTARLRLS